MTKVRKVLRLGLLITFATALNVFFINCSGINFKLSESQSSSKSTRAADNGQGYDGKPGTIYDLIVPDWNCEGKPSPYATLEILNTSAALTVNTKEKCASQVEYVKLSDLVTSPVDKEIIAYRGSLFLLRPGTGGVDLSKIVLAWCRSTLPDHSVYISQVTSGMSAKVSSALGSDLFSPMVEASAPNQIQFSSIDATLTIDRLRLPLSGDLQAMVSWQNTPLFINGMECIGLNPPVIGTVQFKVTTPIDGPDATPGDGVCASGSGSCTLRAAIQESNAQVYPALVDVPDGIYDLGSGGELTVSKSLTLQGASQTNTIIQANATTPSRVFNVTATYMTFSNLTVQNGSTNGVSGGIHYKNTSGSLVLSSISILNNSSATSVRAVGGVFAEARSVIIQNSIFKGNSTGANYAVDYGAAGLMVKNPSINASGVRGIAETTITNTTFEENFGGMFSGGARIEGDKTIKNSRFHGNSSLNNSGGGLAVVHGSTTIDACVFTSNFSGADGGAIFSDYGFVSLDISNSTFFNNSALGGGGALALNVYNAVTPQPSDFPAVIRNSTLIGNSAALGGGIDLRGATIAHIMGTILSVNAGGNCRISPGAILTSQGYNIDSSNTCGFSSVGDLINTDPRVVGGPPVNNGGSTSTLALQNSSPAIDVIPLGPLCPLYDQRGAARPSGMACDIGAFEK